MMMDFLRYKKEAKKDFCNLAEGYKTNKEMNKTSLLEKVKESKNTPSKLYENEGRA